MMGVAPDVKYCVIMNPVMVELKFSIEIKYCKFNPTHAIKSEFLL